MLLNITINPAITHGISEYVGSIEVGKIADLVLWNPAFFGVKPELILKKWFCCARLNGGCQCIDSNTTAGYLSSDVCNIRKSII